MVNMINLMVNQNNFTFQNLIVQNRVAKTDVVEERGKNVFNLGCVIFYFLFSDVTLLLEWSALPFYYQGET